MYINNLCTSGYTTDEILGINSFENIELDSEKSILCCFDQFGGHIHPIIQLIIPNGHQASNCSNPIPIHNDETNDHNIQQHVMLETVTDTEETDDTDYYKADYEDIPEDQDAVNQEEIQDTANKEKIQGHTRSAT